MACFCLRCLATESQGEKLLTNNSQLKTTHSAEGKHNELTCELLIRLTGVALGDRAFEVGGIISEQD